MNGIQQTGEGTGSTGSTPSKPVGAQDAAGTRDALLRETVERTILPHLLAKHPDPAPQSSLIPARMSQELALDSAGAHPERVPAKLERLIEAGADPVSLCLELLAPAARHLGDLWVEDELDFVDVTLGTMRLERAMRVILTAPAKATATPRASRAPRILMMPLPGNQHTFGLTMAADLFRRAGWSVLEGGSAGIPTGSVARGLELLDGFLRTHTLAAIGLAVSCETQIETLERTLAIIRAASSNRQIRIVLGGPLFLLQPEMASRFDADLVVADGSKAPALLAALLPDSDARSGVASPSRPA